MICSQPIVWADSDRQCTGPGRDGARSQPGCGRAQEWAALGPWSGRRNIFRTLFRGKCRSETRLVRKRNTIGLPAKHPMSCQSLVRKGVSDPGSTPWARAPKNGPCGSDPPEIGPRLYKRAFRGGRSRDLSLQEGRMASTTIRWGHLACCPCRRSGLAQPLVSETLRADKRASRWLGERVAVDMRETRQVLVSRLWSSLWRRVQHPGRLGRAGDRRPPCRWSSAPRRTSGRGRAAQGSQCHRRTSTSASAQGTTVELGPPSHMLSTRHGGE